METPTTIDTLEDLLSRPSQRLVDQFAVLEGDILFLGVGGKMGPTMARMAVRASELAGIERRVFGVSRFSDADTRARMDSWGVETIVANLLSEDALDQLPNAAHVVYMSGFKFGAAADPARAWAMNCLAPSLCSKRFRESRITAFSSGNVYGFTRPESGGAQVTDPPAPVGEYAWTALGRERIFQFCCRETATPLTLLRLNYATELRYGVLVDMALAVRDQQPIDVGMSYVNVIWLGDANEMTLRALTLNHANDRVLNMAGADVLHVPTACREFGELLGVEPNLIGQESTEALLNNGADAYADLGAPAVDAQQMIEWTADWVGADRPLLGKPTHFGVRDGKF